MKEEDAPDDEATQRPGRLAAAALRVIDAGLRALQKLRDRLEAPAPNDDSAHDRKKTDEAGGDEAAAAAPRQKTLLHRALILLLCLLLGATAGGLVSYRAFSKTLDARAHMIENMQIELSELRKVEERGLDAKAKSRAELNDYRKQLRETQHELATSQKKIDQLDRQLNVAKRVERPATRTAAPSAARPRTPQKTGTCVTRPEDPPGKLQECLDKFNQP